MRKHLEKLGLWNDKKEAELAERAAKEVADAVARAENIAPPAAPDFFNSMYEELPADLVVQRETMHTHSLGQDPSQIEGAEHLQKPRETAKH